MTDSGLGTRAVGVKCEAPAKLKQDLLPPPGGGAGAHARVRSCGVGGVSSSPNFKPGLS